MSGLVPVSFGSDLTLFGMLSVPETAGHGERGIVICSPLGHENICAYRPLRTLAERFAERGFPTLRFDWPGSGDSADPAAGSTFELTAWTSAVGSAVDALRSNTGVDNVTLVGLRIGATLGWVFAAAEPMISEIALLAPFTTGRAYLRELQAFQALTEQTDPGDPSAQERVVEKSGFALTAAEGDAFESVELGVGSVTARRVLVVSSQPSRRTDDFVGRLSETVSEVVHDVMPAIANLWTGPNISALPHACGERICDWLLAGTPPTTKTRHLSPRHPARIRVDGRIAEEPVFIETPHGRLFGVASGSPQALDSSDEWVVFLNPGRLRRVGPNRLWTEYARIWARSGLPSFRLDARGIGDSDGDRVTDETPGQHDGQSYVPGLVDDVHEALAWLAANHGARRFALIGLCSGATWGFQAALSDDRIKGVSLLNPRTLLWNPAAPQLKAFREARRIARSPLVWRRALAGNRPGGRYVLRGAWLTLRGKGQATDRRWILDSMARLREQQTSLQFIFSAGDLGVGYFEQQLGVDFPAVLEASGATVEVITGPDHMFRPQWSHEVLRHALERQLAEIGFPGELKRLATSGTVG